MCRGCLRCLCPLLTDDETSHEDDHHETITVLRILLGYVRLQGENAIGGHVDILRRLSHAGFGRHVSIGASVDAIAGHDHYSVMAPVGLHPWRGVELTAAPGWEWERHESEWERHPTVHFSAAYVVERGALEAGPSLEFSKSAEGPHFALNLHCLLHL